MTPELIARVDAWLAKQEYLTQLGVGWHTLQRYCSLQIPAMRGTRDAISRGILLALVREAWAKPGGWDASRIYVEPYGDTWIACWPNRQRLGGVLDCESEAETLVTALEAAPQ